MAVYDMAGAIAKPNLLASVQQGYAFGTQQRQVREDEQRQNQLRTLAPKVIAGDQAAYEQASGIDYKAASELRSEGDNELRRLKGGMDYLRDAMASGNPQRIAAAEAQVGPYVSRIAGKPWTPGALTADPAAFEQAYARIAMVPADRQDQEPAGFRQAHLTAIASGYQPGTPEYQRAMQVAAGTAPRAIPDGFTTRSYRDANGQEVVELVKIRGEGAGQQQSVPQTQPTRSYAFQPPAPGAEADPAANLSPEEQQIAGRLLEAGMTFAVQNGRVVPSGTAPPAGWTGAGNAPPAAPAAGAGRGQTDAERAAAAAEQAAMVERAKIEAQLSTADRVADADAQREAAVVTARTGATNQAERDQVQRTNNTAYAQYTAARDTLLQDLGATTTGPIAGRLPAVTEGQQIAEGAQARMAPILKGLFRTAGEGTFTDKDQALLMAMVPTRTDLPGAVKAKMAGIDAIIEAKLQQGGGQPEAAAPVEGARQAPDGNWYVQQNGQYFKVDP